MTIRQLIKELESVDEDVKDYQFGVMFHTRINEDLRMAGRSTRVEIPENVDVDKGIYWLKVGK